jgi:hypothetical protein
MNAILVQGHRMPSLRRAHSAYDDLDPDMAFAKKARELVGLLSFA